MASLVALPDENSSWSGNQAAASAAAAAAAAAAGGSSSVAVPGAGVGGAYTPVSSQAVQAAASPSALSSTTAASTADAGASSSSSVKHSPASASSGGSGWISRKVVGVTVEKGIVYGNTAQYLGRKVEHGDSTHRWTTYVRGVNGEAINHFVQKVVFSLHSSFQNPQRVVEKPPFEITEMGWGEFQVSITIHFADPKEASVRLYHPLKLYPTDGQTKASKMLVAEHSDYIVFNNPSESFYQLLQLPCAPSRHSTRSAQSQPPPPAAAEEESALDRRVQDAQKRVHTQLQKAVEKHARLEKQARLLHADIDHLHALVATLNKLPNAT